VFLAGVGLTLDDWFMVLTLLSGIPSTIIVSLGAIPNGLGRDIWTLTPDQITNFGMFFFAMTVLYFAQVALLKMSLLFFYLKVFPDAMAKRLLWGTVALNAVFGTVYVLAAVFQCRPIDYFWTKWDGEHRGSCININSVAWSNAIISICLDFWMLGIPLWQLRLLHLHWKKKIGEGIMFGTGAFVSIVSIIRLGSLITFANSENPTWNDLEVSTWSSIEINIGIICAGMPTLRLLMVRVFPALGSHRTKGQYDKNSGSKLGNPRSAQCSRGRTFGASPAAIPTPGQILYDQTRGSGNISEVSV